MPTSATWAAVVAGFAFGLSLIVVIGAQNVYVLRQGARQEHVMTVVAICSVSDMVLIAAGVGGTGAVLAGRPWLSTVARAGGAAFLCAYGAIAARRVWRPVVAQAGNRAGGGSWAAVAGACMAFTWLNPAVYLDTVVVLGSVANARPGHEWWFGAGATMASIVWFCGLGFGARTLGPVLARPGAWRLLDGFVAVVMAGTALRLLLAG